MIFWRKVTAFSAIFSIFAPKFYGKMKKLIVFAAISLLFNTFARAQEEVSDSIGGSPEEQMEPVVVQNILCEDTWTVLMPPLNVTLN